MVSDMEFQFNWLGSIFLIIGLTEITSLNHLSQNDIAALTTTLRASDGVIVGRILTQADKRGSLHDCQIFWLFAEIHIRGSLNTNGIMKEVKIIEIHGDDLVLRIIALKLQGYHPLYRFLEHALQGRTCMFRI